MTKASQQRTRLSSKWWIVVNLAMLPFAGLSIFVIAGFITWSVSFNGFDLKLWAEFLPIVVIAGGLCGVALGLMQGFTLYDRDIRVRAWVLATSLGIAVDAVLTYSAWQLFSLAESKTLAPQAGIIAYTSFILIAVFHGCFPAFGMCQQM